MIRIKTDVNLLVFHAIVLVGSFGLMIHGDVSWLMGTGFLVSAGMIPGYVGRSAKKEKKE